MKKLFSLLLAAAMLLTLAACGVTNADSNTEKQCCRGCRRSRSH